MSMWLCEAKPQDSVVRIGQKLKRRLGIEEKVKRKSKKLRKTKVVQIKSFMPRL